MSNSLRQGTRYLGIFPFRIFIIHIKRCKFRCDIYGLRSGIFYVKYAALFMTLIMAAASAGIEAEPK